MEVLAENCKEFGITLYPMGHPDAGIVHIIGPEQGLTQPGMTIVCGDSHTSTHGAFGALAFGIGTSEVEHVLATQTLPQREAKTLAVVVDGDLPLGVTAKDVTLAIIGRLDTGGGIGSVIEYRGSAIRGLTMEGRMTLCNLSIEAGARAGMIAPDDTTFAYLEGRRHAPKGKDWEAALDDWRTLVTDDDAVFDKTVDAQRRRHRAAGHVGHQPGPGGAAVRAHPVARFLRRSRAQEGRSARPRVHGPRRGHADDRRQGRHRVHRQLHQRSHRRPAGRGGGARRQEGRQRHARACRARIRTRSRKPPRPRVSTRSSAPPGFEWRGAGCSMCLAMNPDKLAPGERAASTSNRNFEGRQGPGGRTHLVSPAVAAATAIAGHFANPKDV